jgi:hypothetical protein
MLTAEEQKYGNTLIEYYRTPVGNSQEKIDDFVYADDRGKQSLIKDFLSTVVAPKKRSEKDVYQAKANSISTEIAAIADYTKP